MKRKKRITNWCALFFPSLLVLGFTITVPHIAVAESTSEENETVSIQLLGINDFHGALNTTGNFVDDKAKKTEHAGTAPLLAGYLNQAEKNFLKSNPSGQSLRVHSGDMVGSSPASSSLLQDEPTIKVLNAMKFSVGTLGSHEFDEGLAEFNRIMKGEEPTEDPYGILKEYPREAAKSEVIVGNLVKKGTEEIPFGFKPYTIKEVGKGDKKVKVGFIGIVTAEVPKLVLQKHYTEYDFLDEAETIAYYSSQLQEKGVKAIVVLAHIPATSKSEQVFGEASDIMKKVNKIYPENSVDVFFAGRNHQFANGKVNKTRIVQSTSHGKGFVDVQGKIDIEKQDFVETPTAKVLPVDPKGDNVPKVDKKVEEIVKDAQERVKKVTEKKISTAKEAKNIVKETNEAKESPLGNLIADAQLSIAKKEGYGADFAMLNDSSIRSDLKVKEDRSIIFSDAQAVQPLGNVLQMIEMTGEQIQQVLNEQYDEGERYFLQIAGLKYRYTVSEKKEQSFKVVDMKKMDGTPIKSDQKYRVIVNDFLYGGGDGFKGFTKGKILGGMMPDTETFIKYLENKEAAGEEIEAKVEERKKFVRMQDIIREEINSSDQLKNITYFDPLYEKEAELTGATIPDSEIRIVKGDKFAEKKVGNTELPKGDIAGKSDSTGVIKISVKELNLKKGDHITVLVMDKNKNKAKFSLEVLAEKQQASDKGEDTDTTKKDKGNLPSTGDKIRKFLLIGTIVVAIIGCVIAVLRYNMII